jgi:phosphoglycolate phosphatase-like HAD superfamily hydrolase
MNVSILFWDIDGTLVRTQGAGVDAFAEACCEVMEIAAFDWTGLDIRGATDRGIARRALAGYDRPSDDAAVDRLLRCYESRLPAHLAKREQAPLPGVSAILDRMAARADVVSMLLTGNTRRGAELKLGHYGLVRYFQGSNGDGLIGAFAEEGVQRDHIAQAALDGARRRVGTGVAAERCFVIGDTPHDVSCGKAIGARTIAVATGGHTAVELLACAPWRVWETLPDAGAFERALGLS